MEHFPFEQFVGLIVFVIIALSQIFGKLRQGRQVPETREPDFEFPDFGPESPPGPKPAQLQLDEALREALGLPPGASLRPGEPARAPQPPALPPRPMGRTPPPLVSPSPPRPQPSVLTPAQRPAPAPAPAFELEEGPHGGVLESLERLERETAIIRERLPEPGRATDDAGGRAEARMQAHLASLTPTLAAAKTVAVAQPKSPLAAMLTDRDALRRAIVLNEILGPPRALTPM